MGRSFGALAAGVLLVALCSFAAVFLTEAGRYSDRISRDYAILYSNELASELEMQIGREITLSVAAASDPVIRDWLLAEDDPGLRAAAERSILTLGSLFGGRDFFIVSEPARRFRFIPRGDSPALDRDIGILSQDNPEDLWFFQSLARQGDYHLNIDTDRFMGTTRVWINAPVRVDGRVAGVLGSGMLLDPLIDTILRGHERRGAKSIIVNGYGAIQLDQDMGNIRPNSYYAEAGTENTVFRYHDSPGFREELAAYFESPERPAVFRLDRGAYRYAAIAPIMDTGWHAVAFFGPGQLYDPRDLIRIWLLLALVLSLTLLALSQSIRLLFLRPFLVLVASLERAEADDDAPIAGLERRDEFGVLARSIRDLAERLSRFVPVGMFLLDGDGRFEFANPYFLQQFACPDRAAFAARFDADLPSLFESEPDYHILRQFLRDRRETLVLETRLRDFRGGAFWARLHLRRLRKQTGREECEGLLINIQHQKETEDRLTNLAATDQLTGLYNRRYLEQWVEEEAKRADRSGTSMSIVMFDLDRFKLVNDTWGHDAGDEVLIGAASSAREALRASDVLIRWGGEEFAAILPGTEVEGAALAAEKLRGAIASRPHPKAGVITASFGVAERISGEAWADWFRRADEALYRAKEAGRNRVETSKPGPDTPLPRAPVRLVWQDSFNSGHETIDNQHKALFQLANHAFDAAVRAAHPDELRAIVAAIHAELARHMSEEEDILAGLGFPEADLAVHRAKHKELAKLGAELAEALRPDRTASGGQSVAPEDIQVAGRIFDFVNQVVFLHMMNDDTLYFPYTRKGASGPAGS